MLKQFFSSLLCALPLLVGITHGAQAASAPPPSPYQLKEQGVGWKLIAVPTATFDNMPFEPPQAQLPSEAGQAGFTLMYMIETLEGLQNSPLSAEMKADLLPDFTADNAQRKSVLKKTQTTKGLAEETGVTNAIFVHKGVADAMSNGTLQSKYANFKQADFSDQQQFFCSAKWYGKSKGGNINISNPGVEKKFDIGRGFTGSVGAKFPAYGKVNYQVNYSYKALSCFPIPYAVRFDNLRAYGEVELNNTNLSLEGKVNYKNSWKAEPIILANFPTMFFVGPVPVIIGVAVPLQYGLDFEADLAGSISYSAGASGRYLFDYTCTAKGCVGNNTSTLQVNSMPPAARSDVSLKVDVKPYVALEAVGYLYHEWIASAGLGVELSFPSSYWAYYGNNCGDADGDGVTEHLRSQIIDVNAQMALYARWKVFGYQKSDWMDWKWPLTDWKIIPVDKLAQGKIPFRVARKNLIFKEFENPATSALTPLILGPATMVQSGGAGYGAMMRQCVPFKNGVEYVMDWGDGSSTAFDADPRTPTYQQHKWPTMGSKTLTLRVKKDDIERDFKLVSSRREINVVPLPAPATPASITAQSQVPSKVLVNWSAASGIVEYYELQFSLNQGNWQTVDKPTGTSSTPSNLAMGNYGFRVRACNVSGCSAYSNVAYADVVFVPAAPVVTGRTIEVCTGRNILSWAAVPGASSYRVFNSQNFHPQTSLPYSQVTSAGAQVYPHQASNGDFLPTYFWVKACNGTMCSDFSNRVTAHVIKRRDC